MAERFDDGTRDSPSRVVRLARRWLSPGLRDLLNRLAGRAIRYDGIYADWNEATSAAAGYDAGALLDHLESAAVAVSRGEAAWEQDGVLHDTIPPDLPQLACLAQVALHGDGDLSVLDFGGGFGSAYRQCRAHLSGLQSLQWHVVEQARIAATGRSRFENGELRFHDSLDAVLASCKPGVALFSGVLHYLPEPYAVLEQVVRAGVEFIVIDRHPRSFTGELITVQRIPPSLYSASYPSWLFDRRKMWAVLARDYDLLLEWPGKHPPIRGKGIGADFVGAFWRRRVRS